MTLPVLCGLGVLVPAAAKAQTTTPPPRPGVILLRPSLAQLRPLVGRVVRITLTDGKQLQARILSAWPGVIQVTFAQGGSGAVPRHRIRTVTYIGPRFLTMAAQDAADSGKLFAYLGVGLTLGGLVLGGAGAPALFVVGNRQTCPGILDCVPPATTAAILVTALSASALAAGVPLWIAGAVRQKVHGRTGPAAARARRLFRGWGMGLTLAGSGLAAVGAALLGASATDPDRLGTLRWAGAITAPLGVFVALCIGLPMWAEAVRQRTADGSVAKDEARASANNLTEPQLRNAVAPHPLASPGITFAYSWQF